MLLVIVVNLTITFEKFVGNDHDVCERAVELRPRAGQCNRDIDEVELVDRDLVIYILLTVHGTGKGF